MDRGILPALISVLLGVSTAGTLGFALPSSHGPEPAARAEGDWRSEERRVGKECW